MKRTQLLSLGACAGLAVLAACGTEMRSSAMQDQEPGLNAEDLLMVEHEHPGNPNQFPNDPNFTPDPNNPWPPHGPGGGGEGGHRCPHDPNHHGPWDPNNQGPNDPNNHWPPHDPNGPQWPPHDPNGSGGAPGEPRWPDPNGPVVDTNSTAWFDHGGNPNNPNDPNRAACHDIEKRLHADRLALKGTSEWQALVSSDEWQTLKADVKKAKDAGCKCNDPNASTECTQLVQQAKDAFTAVQATAQYKAAEATDEWSTLSQDYDDAKANNCSLGHGHHHHPHL